MYIRTQRTQCGNVDYHNIKLHALEHTMFGDLTQACRHTIQHVEVTNTISEGEMAALIMQELRGRVHHGIEISDLCRIIKECFGLAVNYCCDIIQRIKLEAGMYSPDKVHFYYAR